jgi:divalent metal cation (Fe/Co/Zn/Cd) transporter
MLSVNLQQRALALSYVTVAYNIIEGLIAIGAGALAGSIALVGFGLDSFIESLSGGVMIWRFRRREQLTPEQEERIETRAVRLVGSTFFVLSAYVLYESLAKLYAREAAAASPLGIALAVVSLIVMPALFYLKRRTAAAIGSRSLAADSQQTLGCTLLSAALLISLSLNALFGIWWIDPIVGLGVSGFFIKEGVGAIRHRTLCSC